MRRAIERLLQIIKTDQSMFMMFILKINLKICCKIKKLDVWESYVDFETQHGDVMRVGEIRWRAQLSQEQ